MSLKTKYTEKSLTDLLKAKDGEAFRYVYDSYWSKLYISAYNILRDRAMSEDIVQEVFGYLWNNADTVKIKSLDSWLFTAVRYQVFNVIRSGKVREKFENIHVQEISTANLAETKFDEENIRQRLMEGLDSLPPRCKEIFLLSRFDYLSYREISTKLNISEKTVENQISIAIKKLRLSLADILSLAIFILYK